MNRKFIVLIIVIILAIFIFPFTFQVGNVVITNNYVETPKEAVENKGKFEVAHELGYVDVNGVTVYYGIGYLGNDKNDKRIFSAILYNKDDKYYDIGNYIISINEQDIETDLEDITMKQFILQNENILEYDIAYAELGNYFVSQGEYNIQKFEIELDGIKENVSIIYGVVYNNE